MEVDRVCIGLVGGSMSGLATGVWKSLFAPDVALDDGVRSRGVESTAAMLEDDSCDWRIFSSSSFNCNISCDGERVSSACLGSASSSRRDVPLCAAAANVGRAWMCIGRLC